jgi:hypothetical protein
MPTSRGLCRTRQTRRSPPKRAIPYPVQSRGDQAEDGCRDRREEALAPQGSPQDVRHILRRTCSGVVDRDPWPLSRRCDVSTLCASCSVGVQGDHDAAAAVSIRGRGQRVRWPVSVLPKALCRRLISSTGATYALAGTAVVNRYDPLKMEKSLPRGGESFGLPLGKRSVSLTFPNTENPNGQQNQDELS